MIPKNKIEQLKQLRLEIKKCEKCEMRKHYDKPVACAGSPIAKVMFIGEAPGADEVEQGKPFVGASGQMLRSAIINANLNLDDVFITNVLSCRPLNNKFPDNTEYIDSCKYWIDKQIKMIQPKIIVSVGGKAHQYIRKSNIGITKACGIWEEHLFDDFNYSAWYMATLHPSFCMRGPDNRYPNSVMQLDRKGKENLLREHIISVKQKLDLIRGE